MNRQVELKLDLRELRVLAAVAGGWVDYVPEETTGGWGGRRSYTVPERFEVKFQAFDSRTSLTAGEKMTGTAQRLVRLGLIVVGEPSGAGRKAVILTEKGQQYLAKDPRSATVLDAK